MRRIQVATQALLFCAQPGKLLLAERLLPTIGGGLDPSQVPIMIELIVDDLSFALGIEALGKQRIDPCSGMLQRRDVVADIGQPLLVRRAVVLKLGLEALDLGNRFHQPSGIVEDIEFELRIAEHNQRLTGDHAIARLCHYAFDLSAGERVQIHDVLRRHRPVERHDITKRGATCGCDRDRADRYAQTMLRRSLEEHYCNQHRK